MVRDQAVLAALYESGDDRAVGALDHIYRWWREQCSARLYNELAWRAIGRPDVNVRDDRLLQRDTLEVRLALAVLWTILRERSALTAFWDRLLREDAKPWESAHAQLYQVRHALRREGWEAPPVP